MKSASWRNTDGGERHGPHCADDATDISHDAHRCVDAAEWAALQAVARNAPFDEVCVAFGEQTAAANAASAVAVALAGL